MSSNLLILCYRQNCSVRLVTFHLCNSGLGQDALYPLSGLLKSNFTYRFAHCWSQIRAAAYDSALVVNVVDGDSIQRCVGFVRQPLIKLKESIPGISTSVILLRASLFQRTRMSLYLIHRVCMGSCCCNQEVLKYCASGSSHDDSVASSVATYPALVLVCMLCTIAAFFG